LSSKLLHRRRYVCPALSRGPVTELPGSDRKSVTHRLNRLRSKNKTLLRPVNFSTVPANPGRRCVANLSDPPIAVRDTVIWLS